MPRLCLLLGILAITLSGCNILFKPALLGNGNRIVTEREVESFQRLNLVSRGDFTVILGDVTPLVAIEIDDNLQSVIRTEVKGDTLEVKSLRNFDSKDGLVGTIQTERLEEIDVTGSGDVHVIGLVGEHCELDVTGSGDIVANGAVERLDIEITGSGDVDLRDVQSADVTVSITGSGSATVYASQRLRVSITGSGDVRYIGTPQIDQSITGSGSISTLSE